MLQLGLPRQHIQAYALDARSRAGEVLLHQRLVQPDGFKDLRAAVALERRDAHLREDLQQALVDGLLVVLQGLIEGQVRREAAALVQILERLDGQIGIDGAGAVADQQGEVHHLARLARFHDQRHLGARLFANQVVVHRGQRQQAGDRARSLPRCRGRRGSAACSRT